MIPIAIRHLVPRLFNSALGMGTLFLGFYLLYLGFLKSDVKIVVLGGIAIPLGMWLTIRARYTHHGPKR